MQSDDDEGDVHTYDDRGRIVLDEETYTANLEALITKNYFPLLHRPQAGDGTGPTIDQYQRTYTTEDDYAAERILQYDKLNAAEARARMLALSDEYNRKQLAIRAGQEEGQILPFHKSETALMFGTATNEMDLRNNSRALQSLQNVLAIKPPTTTNNSNEVTVIKQNTKLKAIANDDAAVAHSIRLRAKQMEKEQIARDQLLSGKFTKSLDSRIIEQTNAATFTLQNPSDAEQLSDKLRAQHLLSKKKSTRSRESRFGTGGPQNDILNSQLGRMLSEKLRKPGGDL